MGGRFLLVCPGRCSHLITDDACFARYDTMLEETGNTMKWSRAFWFCCDLDMVIMKTMMFLGNLVEQSDKSSLKYITGIPCQSSSVRSRSNYCVGQRA